MVSTRFWSDPWIVDELNPLDRYLFLYLLTNEKVNIIGAYELSLRTMANETGLDKDEVQRMISRLESRVVYVDGWVVFRKMIRHQNYKSPKIESAIAREINTTSAKALAYVSLPDDLCKTLQEIYGIDTVSVGYEYHLARVTPTTTPTTTPTPTPNNNTNSKEQITITNPAVAKATRPETVPKEQIDEMLSLWEAEIGYAIKSETSNRRAIASLIREHGREGLIKLIGGAKLALDDQYAPRISDFVSLRRKENDLMIWGRKRQSKARQKVAVIS
jgi:hypothetical protein